MLAGQFEQAWRISDAVLRRRSGRSCSELPHHLRWVWDGTPLNGRRVLVRCYHGLGDTLQFIRFVPVVASMARAVAVEAQPALLPLLRSMPQIDLLLPLDAAAPPADVHIESMELAHALRCTIGTIPAAVPYLMPPHRAAKPAKPSTVEGRRLRIGIVWAAGNWRQQRSLPPALLAPLTRLPVELVCLQRGPARRAIDGTPLAGAFSSELGETASILDTAELMLGLDLIVTVDTMAAHLAGALARPVWTLLDADADWRWMHDRDDSPWYPTMTLFRQQRQGVWEPVIDRVTAALAELAAQRQGGSPHEVLFG